MACGSSNNALPLDEQGREDFRAFHAKFYADSAFQMARIEFPLMGNDPDGNPYLWTEEAWKIQKTIEENDNIERVPFFDMDIVMRERIIVQKRFMIQNMFSLINNKWYLTEYSGLRDLAFFAPKQQTAPTPSEPEMEEEVSIEEETTE